MLGRIALPMLLLAGCWQASAGSVYIVLDTPAPVNGHQLVGKPGETVGWGFEVFNNSNDYLVFTGSSLIESSYLGPLGTSTGYTDFMGINGGNDIFFVDPNSTWSSPTFNAGTLTGIGSYLIDPGTPLNSEDFGTFSISYDAYNCNPNVSPCTPYNPGQTLFLQGNTLPTFDISVPAPEPSAALPLALLAAGYGCFRLRRRYAR